MISTEIQRVSPTEGGHSPLPYWAVPSNPQPQFKSRTLDTDLEQLKTRMLQTALKGTVNLRLAKPLRRAANEAAALAWLEPLPLLVFPGLFEEKVSTARKHLQKQEFVQAMSSELLQDVA